MQRLKSSWVVVLPALLCACGSSNGTSAAIQAHFGSHHNDGTKRPQAAAGVDADMVAGVSAGGANPPIGLKFLIGTRPVVGVPVQLKLALIPTGGAEIGHIHGTLQAAEGLQLQSQRTFDVDAPPDGKPMEQEVTVIPQRAGVLSLSATLEIDYDNGSVDRTYAIPLIAANAS